jgi:hypothetical protein
MPPKTVMAPGPELLNIPGKLTEVAAAGAKAGERRAMQESARIGFIVDGLYGEWEVVDVRGNCGGDHSAARKKTRFPDTMVSV